MKKVLSNYCNNIQRRKSNNIELYACKRSKLIDSTYFVNEFIISVQQRLSRV